MNSIYLSKLMDSNLFSISIGFFCLLSTLIYPLSIFNNYSILLVIIFILFLAITILLVILAKIEFKKYNQKTHLYEKIDILLVKGIFNYTRNPLYLAQLLSFIGLSFLFNSIYFIVGGVIFYILISYYFIIPEEKYLKDLFEDKYESYKMEVKRWL